MKLSQKLYCERILRKFFMDKAYPKDTPMEKRGKNFTAIKKCNKRYPYREAVGSLLYLANGTRPDISYAVNMLSRKQNNPSLEDWQDVKRVLRYLKGTVNLGLSYKGKTDKLRSFSDSSLGDCADTKRSTSGILVKVFGDCVFWSSKRQNTVAGSTCEAEYVALNSATVESIALNAMMTRAIGKSFFPVKIYCDNKAAIESASKPGSVKLKHLTDIKMHYILENVAKGVVKVKWVPSQEQEADIFTKPLRKKEFIALRDRIVQIV